jgi:hypothetical protein
VTGGDATVPPMRRVLSQTHLQDGLSVTARVDMQVIAEAKIASHENKSRSNWGIYYE